MDPSPVAEQTRKRFWPALAGVLVLALGARAAVLWRHSAQLGDDRDNYRRIAQHLAAGDGFVDPDTKTPTAYRPPLYPCLLSAIFVCGGSNVVIGIVQIGLGVATVVLTVLAGMRLGLQRA